MSATSQDVLRKLPTYTPTNPLWMIAEFFGLDYDEEIWPVTGGDHNVHYGETRRWHFPKDGKFIVVNLFRMPSGSYEINAYKS